MSILRSVITDAFASAFRKKSSTAAQGALQTHIVATTSGKVGQANVPQLQRAGMTVVILNWDAGENDPFTVVNETLRQHFRASGKNAEIVELSEATWGTRLAQLSTEGIDFALTWQGLGSSTTVGESNESIWDRLRIPLMCIHGDHPCHMPLNHQLESEYCFHLYANAEFARYSNRHFRHRRGASMIDIPQLHREKRFESRAGTHFVFAKNVTDPLDAEALWRQQFDKPTFDAYMIGAEILKSRISSESYVEVHDVLDNIIVELRLNWLEPTGNTSAYHRYHSQLDHYLRSYKSICAVNALAEIPLRIYGRGWERVAQKASHHHIFEAGRSMADSQFLYHTRFGLVDVSPSKGLHDRTRRAMANGCGFLSSANLEDSFADIGKFDALFFNFVGSDLAEKCADVMREPEQHHLMAKQFADIYHNRFHFKDFVNRLDVLAKLVRYRASATAES